MLGSLPEEYLALLTPSHLLMSNSKYLSRLVPFFENQSSSYEDKLATHKCVELNKQVRDCEWEKITEDL